MEEALELKCLISLVLHVQLTFQLALSQRDAVDKPKLVWPLLLHRSIQHRPAQAKVQLDTVVRLAAQTFTAALAQELPETVSRKAMLRELAGGMGLGGWSEYREDQGDPATNGLGSIEGRGVGEEQLFGAVCGFPGRHGGPVQVHGD